MEINFHANDPSVESQWRALILFGKNSATYKFAFGKALLNLVSKGVDEVTLKDLSPLFVESILDHIKSSDKQGNSTTSKFLNACRNFNVGEISYDELLTVTERYGFVNVIDAFQNINGGVIPSKFYEKDFNGNSKRLIITDELLKLGESVQFSNLDDELNARWNLVETAWNLNVSPTLLEVKISDNMEVLYIESDFMKRKDITSARASLNGYQKGKCFYSYQDISIISGSTNLCEVDHFFPHVHKLTINDGGGNVNGIWNLVLADRFVNNHKRARIPEIRFLERLYRRNEFYVNSKHPLGETIINQTGRTPRDRQKFLQHQYNLSLSLSIQQWSPLIEQTATF